VSLFYYVPFRLLLLHLIFSLPGDGCAKNLSSAIRCYQDILSEPPKHEWVHVSEEVLDLYSWRMNMKTFEMKAQLAQLMSERLLV
jgi:hypothetical protein